MRQYGRDQGVLRALRDSAEVTGKAEILVAEGRSPSLQRNRALELAKGEIVVFLDNDCQPCPGYWRELESALSRPGVDIVGGPALLRLDPTWNEKIFHALLAHPLLAGPVFSRYTVRGEFRAATQSELILCNLSVRRPLIDRVGPFSPRLHPNEENEWLDRAARLKLGIFYDPLLAVRRPQRNSWGDFFAMLFRYGMGRTRQFYVSGRWSVHQWVPLLLIIIAGAWMLGENALRILLWGWLLVSALIGFTCEEGLDLTQRIMAGLVAPLVPLVYALGQVVGWVALLVPPFGRNVGVTLRDGEGAILAAPQAR